jgi:cell division protein FtsL
VATAERTGRQILPQLLRAPSTPILLIASALAIGSAALVPLVASSVATSTNGNIARLEQQRDDWQARIRELELEVAGMAGLNRIETVARTDLKMTEPRATRYVTVAAGPPEERRLPSRYLPPKPEEREAEPAIWEKVLGWLPLP